MPLWADNKSPCLSISPEDQEVNPGPLAVKPMITTLHHPFTRTVAVLSETTRVIQLHLKTSCEELL